MKGERKYFCFFTTIILLAFSFSASAQNVLVNLNADLVSRYIWRGLNVNDQPNIQPAITFKLSNLQF